MTKITFPKMAIPAFKLTAGQLCNKVLLVVPIVIPPNDITFWDEIVLMQETTIWDSDWIVTALTGAFTAIPNAVWALFKGTLDDMADQYYKDHPKEETT